MSDDFEITIPKQKPKPREYSLQIDCRENAVVKWYKNSPLLDDDRVTVERMDTGDFIFLKDNAPFVCIERKRIDDFASSIRDGRYKTQKLEMIEFSNQYNPRPFLVYLVEQFSIKDDEDAKTLIGETTISKETLMSAIQYSRVI
jgi:ERCC4-type nuclease